MPAQPNYKMHGADGLLSRREFIARAANASFGVAVATANAQLAGAPINSQSPIVVFSKVYQELNLGFEEAAQITADADLQGVDCPLRPGGEILPERVADDLPRYAAILRRNNLQLPLLTTGITSTSSPHAEEVLKTAKGLGIHYYRLGFIVHRRDISAPNLLSAVKAQLKELAALNKQLGMCVLLQNHSPSGDTVYFGGNLQELRNAVQDFDSAQIGVAFDIGHALVVHGDDWRKQFEQLKSHFKIAYVKDVKRSGGWVPFGQGDIAATGYFSLLKQMGYKSPISMHIEFDWGNDGKNRNRTALLQALKSSAKTLHGWLAQA